MNYYLKVYKGSIPTIGNRSAYDDIFHITNKLEDFAHSYKTRNDERYYKLIPLDINELDNIMEKETKRSEKEYVELEIKQLEEKLKKLKENNNEQ